MDGDRPALAALETIDDATARKAINLARPTMEAEVHKLSAALRDRALEASDLRAVAEVAVLEAFLTHRPGRGSLSFWTRRVIRWRLVEVINPASWSSSALRNQHEVPLEAPELVLDGENPEEILQALELREWMESHVGQLSPRRAVIIVATARGETHRELGATLGIGRSRVCQERKNAIDTLRERALEDGLADE